MELVSGRTAHRPLHDTNSSPASIGRPSPAVLALIICGALGVYCFLAYLFFHLKIFDQYNVLFDTDASQRKSMLANGWSDNTNYIHALVQYYFTPAFRGIYSLIHMLGLTQSGPIEFRETLALLIPPFAGLAYNAAFAALLQRMGLSARQIYILVLVSAFSFTSLIFFSVPEYYGMTGACFMTGLFLYYRFRQSDKKSTRLLWFVFQVVAIGVTITNSVFTALMTWQRNGGSRQLKSMALAAVETALALVVVVTVSTAAGIGRQTASPSEFAAHYLASDLGAIERQAEHTVLSVADAFSPPHPGTVKPLNAIHPGDKYQFQVSFVLGKATDIYGRIVGLIMVALVALGGYSLFQSEQHRGLAIIAVGTLAFNIALNSVWGSPETFLYSEHWHGPCLILLAGLFVPGTRFRNIGSPLVMGTACAALLVSNAVVMVELLSLLRAS